MSGHELLIMVPSGLVDMTDCPACTAERRDKKGWITYDVGMTVTGG